MFTRQHPGEDEIGRYYESDDYISHSDTSEGLINKAYRIVRKMMLIRKRKLVTNLTGLEKGCILDIGSGTGYFGAEMKAAGWNVSGIEISEKAREFSRGLFNLDVRTPDEIRSFENNSFDCITLWHVLEHFQDPDKYIADISSLLKPEGICIIALPNCTSADADYYRRHWAAYDVPRHLWHFSPQTFRMFAEKNRMELIRLMNLPFDVFYISILSEKYRGSKIPAIAGGFRALIFSLQTLFNRHKSSSIIYILKKH